jgi:hypothetical protein
MTAKFKVGDKVRCVSDLCTGGELVTGNVYSVIDYTKAYSETYLYLKGVDASWSSSRFELAEVTSEPTTLNFTVGQEVFLIANTSNCTKRLKSAVVLDAVPKHDMIRVSVGDIDCYVEEDRLFVKE